VRRPSLTILRARPVRRDRVPAGPGPADGTPMAEVISGRSGYTQRTRPAPFEEEPDALSPLRARDVPAAGRPPGRRAAVTAPAVRAAAPVAPGSPLNGRAYLLAARAALPVALLLWLLSLRNVALDRMGDLGLLQVLPVLYWVAIGLLTVGFALTLHDRRSSTARLTGYVLGLVAVIHATPSLLYPTLRYSWAWKHIAVIEAMIQHNGSVPNTNGLDIYNQWPGFFVLNGLLLRTTGLHSALGYAAWTPPVLNALLLGPLLLLYRTVTQDRQLVWGGVWIFYSCSWVGQDYFSPQAFAFLLYVVLVAVVFRRLAAARARPAGAADPEPGRASTGASPIRATRRGDWPIAQLLLVLVIEAAIISSHQLTPLMLLTALIALSLPRANRRITLPLLLAALVMQLVWLTTVARPYISANLGSFGKALLTPDGNAVSGLAGLGAAAPGQVVVDWIDRSLSATVLLLAVACFVRRPWVRRSGIPLVALSPVPLLAANSYGGEMIFRVYLFALPAMAFLVAVLVLRPGCRPRLRMAVVSVLLLALLGGLFFAYDSKEQMNYFTRNEVAAARYVTTNAPPGSVIVTLTGNVPGLYARYDRNQLVLLSQSSVATQSLLIEDPVAGLQQALAGTTPGASVYLLLTRGQAAECYLTGVLPADTESNLESALRGYPVSVVYRNADATVYRFDANAFLTARVSAPARHPARPAGAAR